mgnify:CR=1 FL=1
MIEAYLPRPDELWFRRKMLADEATMAYNGAYGGTVDFPEERWPDWYDRWVAHPEGRYYRYLRESASGEFVGEIAYHFDGEKYLADVIVYAPGEKGSGGMTAAYDKIRPRRISPRAFNLSKMPRRVCARRRK